MGRGPNAKPTLIMKYPLKGVGGGRFNVRGRDLHGRR